MGGKRKREWEVEEFVRLENKVQKLERRNHVLEEEIESLREENKEIELLEISNWLA